MQETSLLTLADSLRDTLVIFGSFTMFSVALRKFKLGELRRFVSKTHFSWLMVFTIKVSLETSNEREPCWLKAHISLRPGR